MVLTGDREVGVRESARLDAWTAALSDAHHRNDDQTVERLTEWLYATDDTRLRRMFANRLIDQDLAQDPLYHNVTRRLTHDPDPYTATAASVAIIDTGHEKDELGIFTDATLAERVGPQYHYHLRFQAARHSRSEAVVRLLANDPAPQVAIEALLNEHVTINPWRVLLRDRYLRGVWNVMWSRRWCVWFALTDPEETIKRFARRITRNGRLHKHPEDAPRPITESLTAAREALKTGDPTCCPRDDRFADRLTLANNYWWRATRNKQPRQPVRSEQHAQRFCDRILTNPSLLRRHPDAAVIADNLQVRYDKRIRYRGRAFPTTTTIRVNPKRHRVDQHVLLHELAHLLVYANPRFHHRTPTLGNHDPAFVAVMLDLVRVAYGRLQRWRLRIEYLRFGVPVLRPPRQRRGCRSPKTANGGT